MKQLRHNGMALLAALIWGTAFVAQSVGADYVEPFSFNTARSAIAFLFLLVLCLVRRTVQKGVVFVEVLANIERIVAHLTNVCERAREMSDYHIVFPAAAR